MAVTAVITEEIGNISTAVLSVP